jgi:hypothetical protein
LAEEQAKREAEERRALEALEAELRGTLEQEAQAHAAELRSELERESQARVEEGLQVARKRTRLAIAAAVVAVLVSGLVYGVVLGPRMERQTLEIERMRQQAVVLQRENQGLEQKVEELERDLTTIELRPKEAAPAPSTHKPPRQKPQVKRERPRDPLQKPACDENDPLCGI